MKDYINKIFVGDKILWIIVMFLFIISGVEMFSAISQKANGAEFNNQNPLGPFFSHLAHLSFGGIIMIFISRIEFDRLRKYLFYISIIFTILVCITPIIGKDANGAKRAIEIATIDVHTIELGKFALIIFLSEILGRNYLKGDPLRKEKFPMKRFWVIIAILTIFSFAITLQNLSTTIMLIIISIILMIIAEVDALKIVTFLGGLVGFVAIALLIILFLVPEEKQPRRFQTWKNRGTEFVQRISSNTEQEDIVIINDKNRQILNSEIAIAKGIYPCGPGNSTQREVLPLVYSDFIYAIIIEEYGIYGGIFIILLYLSILVRAGRIANKCDNHLVAALMAIGLTLLIVIQAFISMGVTVHLGPVTGQPLPLISRGGTSIALVCACLGVIFSISNYVDSKEKKKGNNIDEISHGQTSKSNH